jgi:hypothetical protein
MGLDLKSPFPGNDGDPMNSTPKSLKAPASTPLRAALGSLLALALLGAFTGCAGSKKSSSNYDSLGSASSEPTISPSQQRVDEAKRSAEEAEQRAHDLRVEKAKSKSGN